METVRKVKEKPSFNVNQLICLDSLVSTFLNDIVDNKIMNYITGGSFVKYNENIYRGKDIEDFFIEFNSMEKTDVNYDFIENGSRAVDVIVKQKNFSIYFMLNNSKKGWYIKTMLFITRDYCAPEEFSPMIEKFFTGITTNYNVLTIPDCKSKFDKKIIENPILLFEELLSHEIEIVDYNVFMRGGLNKLDFLVNFMVNGEKMVLFFTIISNKSLDKKKEKKTDEGYKIKTIILV